MASKVQIANLALALIGEEPIISFDDDTKPAQKVKLIFDDERDAELRAHPWNFAIKRRKLAKSAEVPAFGFDNKFGLPPDFLRILGFNENEETPYQLEADGIHTDADEARLRYVARITDPTKYDTLFVRALAARLAFFLVEPMSADTELRQVLREEYRDVIALARSTDGMENPVVEVEPDDFIIHRFGSVHDFRAQVNKIEDA